MDKIVLWFWKRKIRGERNMLEKKGFYNDDVVLDIYDCLILGYWVGLSL